MAVEVTIRHQDASNATKLYATQRAEKIVERFPKLDSIRVVVDSQRHLYEAEVVAHIKDQTAVGGKEHATNIRSAIDMAAARVERQLRKNRKKIVSVHTRP